ncbi:MAG TPA: ABC transporter permease [Ktedonobacterales bacterium]|nr:ABC transporter permease [Ktedonobacterales bacterium]
MADLLHQTDERNSAAPADSGRPNRRRLWALMQDAGKRRRFVDLALDYGIYVLLVGLLLYFSFASPYFLSVRNLFNILLAVSVTGIIAAGMTVALIAGQIDLTVGAVIGLTTVITSSLVYYHGFSFLAGVLIALVIDVLIGLLTSLLVVNLAINSIIATLAMTLVIQGVALILANGETIPMVNLDLVHFINARPFGIPIPVIGLLIAFVAGFILLNYLRLGWHIYATGGNPSAALRAAIPINRIYRFVFLLTAFLAGIGGVITAGMAASGSGAYGVGEEFDVLAAVLLGGIGLSGGSGRIERTLVGVLIVGVVNNGLVLMNIPSFYQDTVKGFVLLLAVVMSALRYKRSSR